MPLLNRLIPICVLLVLFAPGGSSAGAAQRHGTCRIAPGWQLELRTARTLITVRYAHPPGQDAVGMWRACLLHGGRQIELFRGTQDDYGFRSSAGPFAAAGRYVAFIQSDVDGRYQSEAAYVHEIDLKTARNTLDPHDPLLAPEGSIETLDLNAHGDLAWLIDFEPWFAPGINTAIYAHDQKGTRLLAGPGKGLSGPSMRGNHVRWLDNGQPHSATLN